MCAQRARELKRVERAKEECQGACVKKPFHSRPSSNKYILQRHSRDCSSDIVPEYVGNIKETFGLASWPTQSTCYINQVAIQSVNVS